MISLADFFPDGLVRFVPPPFDEKYWAHFVYPAQVRTDLWGSSCQRGVAYKDMGAPAAAGTPGQVRKISSGRKERGRASDDYKGKA